MYRIRATGEMSQHSLEKGGEFYEARLELEALCKDAGVECQVKPFDVYQGPYADFKLGTKRYTLWYDNEVGDDSSFVVLEGGPAGKPVANGDAEYMVEWLTSRKETGSHLRLVKSFKEKLTAAYQLLSKK